MEETAHYMRQVTALSLGLAGQGIRYCYGLGLKYPPKSACIEDLAPNWGIQSLGGDWTMRVLPSLIY
jgi:hypothetical protein